MVEKLQRGVEVMVEGFVKVTNATLLICRQCYFAAFVSSEAPLNSNQVLSVLVNNHSCPAQRVRIAPTVVKAQFYDWCRGWGRPFIWMSEEKHYLHYGSLRVIPIGSEAVADRYALTAPRNEVREQKVFNSFKRFGC